MSSVGGPTSSSLGLLFVRVLPVVLVLLLLVVSVGRGALFFVDMVDVLFSLRLRPHRGVVKNNAPNRPRFPPEGEI
jgi:hypothetical protein